MTTPISYYGGKQSLVPEILPLFPEHSQYVEPFLGGGAVFFKKPKSAHEVINDLDGRITNFYSICQSKYSELKTLIDSTLHSEILHRKAADLLKSGEGSDVELAWALWVQCNMSFGNKIFAGFAFSDKGGQARATANKRDNFTIEYCNRLKDVEIFQRDAIDVIKLKDSENSFFYCDPPYVSSDCGHYKGYTKEDFISLLELLSTIKGRFLLSSYPEPELQSFIEKNGWNQRQIKQIVQVNGKREETKYKIECLTWNYPEPLKQLSLLDFE